MPPDQGQPFAQFIEFGVQFLHRSGSSVVLFDMVLLRGLWRPAEGRGGGLRPGQRERGAMARHLLHGTTSRKGLRPGVWRHVLRVLPRPAAYED